MLVLPEEEVRDAITVMHDTGVSQVVVSVTKELPLAAKEVVGTLRELELMDLIFRDGGVLDRPIAAIMSPPMPMIGIGEPVARVVSCLEQGPVGARARRRPSDRGAHPLRRAVVPRRANQDVNPRREPQT